MAMMVGGGDGLPFVVRQNRQKVRPLIGLDDHQLQPAETTLGTYVDCGCGNLYQQVISNDSDNIAKSNS